MRITACCAAIALAAVSCGDDRSLAEGAYVVQVQVDGPGRLLSLPPAIDCPGTCAALFPGGSWITLVATSGDGVSFVEWSRGCSGATGCSFTLTTDVEVEARFEQLAAAQKK
ncbi:MAG TPA: hypothetical protein VG496_11415 [Myxococcales bacterium]|nr:hypothetical protein [Myxococcales bacterium]